MENGSSIRAKQTDHFPPVISLALNFAGGGVGELEKETYCIRRSAKRLSSILSSCSSRFPFVFFSSMPSTSIQCFAVWSSTPVSPVTGCGIIPKLAAAFDASDMIKLRKLVGSSSGSPDAGRVRVRVSDVGLVGAAAGSSAGGALGGALSATGVCSDSATRSASSFSSGESSRGVPSELKGRRSTTLNVGCSSLMVLGTLRRVSAQAHVKLIY